MIYPSNWGGGMMRLGPLVLGVLAAVAVPVSALAGEQGFFAGVDATGGMAFGSSGTTDGGAPSGGGGTVSNVKFGGMGGIGGHVGYQFDPALSASISYQHIRGSIGWDTNFAAGGATRFDGTAISNVVLANVAYEVPVSERTMLRTTVGAGLTFNTLSRVVETLPPGGQLNSILADHTEIGAAAQVGLGLRHTIAPNVVAGLDGLVAYASGFETGSTRNSNTGVSYINPYKIDNVWRAMISASIKVNF